MIVFWAPVAISLAVLIVVALRTGFRYGLTGVYALVVALLTLVYILRGSR